MGKPAHLVFLGLLLLLASTLSMRAEHFRLCEGIYALCTAAKCAPVPGKDDAVACTCAVRLGYSAGRSECRYIAWPNGGEQIQSRYYPVKKVSVCSNDRTWANCLDKTCVVDKANPFKAKCTCTKEKNAGPYVVAGNTHTPETCTSGTASAATVADNEALTDYLKATGLLKPYVITVLNKQPSTGQDRQTP